MKRPALFFDRDGIIVNPIKGEAPKSAKQLELITDIIPVLKESKQKDYLIIVVSNQPDIALGLINEKTKNELEAKFLELMSVAGIEPDKIYYCHHDKNGTHPKYSIDCDCRKPKPGLLKMAAKDFEIDLDKSFMIGDRASDIKAGQLAGVRTVLLDPHNLQLEYLKKHNAQPDFKIDGLWQILQII